MGPVSHQTIKLARGKHDSPEQGACVMELASMLAGEPFGDHPRSVCPVIGDLLRTYNDKLDDARRQDLYRYAAEVVGSRGPRYIREARSARIGEWILAQKPTWARRAFGLPMKWLVIWAMPESPGARAVQALGRVTDRSHATMLALIDELLEIGAPSDGWPSPLTAAPAALQEAH